MDITLTALSTQTRFRVLLRTGGTGFSATRTPSTYTLSDNKISANACVIKSNTTDTINIPWKNKSPSTLDFTIKVLRPVKYGSYVQPLNLYLEKAVTRISLKTNQSFALTFMVLDLTIVP